MGDGTHHSVSPFYQGEREKMVQWVSLETARRKRERTEQWLSGEKRARWVSGKAVRQSEIPFYRPMTERKERWALGKGTRQIDIPFYCPMTERQA